MPRGDQEPEFPRSACLLRKTSMKPTRTVIVVAIVCLCLAATAHAQPSQSFYRPSGSGTLGPPVPTEELKLVERFDRDRNGWLDQRERAAARPEAAAKHASRPGFGPPGGSRERGERPPGQRLSPNDVPHNTSAALYDPAVLRTLFFEFENEDWERELADFHDTDVEVTAHLTVDGRRYSHVGMRFRGLSSYNMAPIHYKRSFNVSIDFVHEDQRLYGYKTLNLLNSAGDPSYMSTVLYSHIARQYIPTPKANHVRVVINGEDWGIYVNEQQFDKIFLDENFESSKGTRWKVSGHPAADGGLRYVGEDLEEYKRRYEMKSDDGKKAWAALILLCKTLKETPLEDLEDALEPMLDIDETLRFLALDVALVNSDGYWTRASDYSLFRDEDKRFHLIPYDMNEAFKCGKGDGQQLLPPGQAPPAGQELLPGQAARPAGPSGEGPPDAGVDLDPLVGIDNPRMPLRSRLLAVPKLRQKYLAYVREIAEKSLDWSKMEPILAQRVKLIEPVVKADTHKLETFVAFQAATSLQPIDPNGPPTLRSFFEQRRDFLLNYKELTPGVVRSR